jgi:adenylate cyclase
MERWSVFSNFRGEPIVGVPRGPIAAKHERTHEMFFLNRLKPEFSRDADGRIPNENFIAECNQLQTGFSGWRA